MRPFLDHVTCYKFCCDFKLPTGYLRYFKSKINMSSKEFKHSQVLDYETIFEVLLQKLTALWIPINITPPCLW